MNKEEKVDLNLLNSFLIENKEIDFRTADFLHPSNISQYKWAKFEEQKESLIDGLKAYQRMLRVVPEGREDLAQKLLEKGIKSSRQIANMPKETFIQNNLKLFDDKDDAAARQLARRVYMNAVSLREAVILQYITRAQQAEPHVRRKGLMR